MSDDAGARRDERRVLWVTSAGHLLSHLYMLVFPALVSPIRAELGLDLRAALDLSFPGYLLYGLGALPAGYLTDRWQARGMLAIGMAASGAGAVAAGLARTPGGLMAALAAVGLGASVYHPTGMSLLSRTFVGNRGRALGLNGVFGNVGIAGAPFLAGLLGAIWGWRVAFVALGVPGLVAGLVTAFSPIDERRAEGPSREQPSAPGAAAARAPAPGTGGGRDVPATSEWRVRYFALLCAAMTLGGLVYTGASALLPTYFEARATFLGPVVAAVQAAGLHLTGAKTLAATTLTSLVYVVGIAGQLLGGYVADRRDLRLGYLAFHAATIPALFAMSRLAEVPLFVAAFSYTLFGLGMQPIENSLVAKLTPAAWRSTAYGLKFILTFGVGAAAVGLAGRIQERLGLPAVFAVMAAAAGLLVALAFALWVVSRRALPALRNEHEARGSTGMAPEGAAVS
ncbi:MAG TPA: MFS transporter [Myxococcota bacterium]|nr:MFS transporter [Myxococcota bacterium]